MFQINENATKTKLCGKQKSESKLNDSFRSLSLVFMNDLKQIPRGKRLFKVNNKDTKRTSMALL